MVVHSPAARGAAAAAAAARPVLCPAVARQRRGSPGQSHLQIKKVGLVQIIMNSLAILYLHLMQQGSPIIYLSMS